MNTLVLRCCRLLILLALASGCGGHREEKPRLGEVERLPRLETVRPEMNTRLVVARTYLATVEPFEKVDLCAQVRGVVGPIPATTDIGSVVKKGQVLLQLEIPDLLADREHKKALLEQMVKSRELAAQTMQVVQAEIKEADTQVKRYQAEENYRKIQADRVTQLAQGDTVARQLADEAQLQLQAARRRWRRPKPRSSPKKPGC